VRHKSKIIVSLVPLLFMVLNTNSLVSQTSNDDDLLRARESVWRAWFIGDAPTLKELVPSDTIVMSGGKPQWRRQSDVLQASAQFHAQGGKLIRLEFPRTEVQHYGDVAIIWSDYRVETEEDGKRVIDAGRVTEVFVWRNGHWTNPGWHTDKD
jgi:ketosteroid isomerase-like protein